MSPVRSGDGGGMVFLPYALLLMLMLAGNVPSHFSGLERLEIGLFFVPLFFIGLTSESDFTPLGLLALGFLNDLLRETPLGYWSLLFVIFYGLTLSQRGVRQNTTFGTYWFTFAILVSIIYFVAYLVSLMRADMAVNSLFMLLSCIACMAFFPVVFGPIYLFRDRIVSGGRD